MLVLSRKIGETVAIGDNVVVQVLSLHESNVRLGIVAPQEISVDRGEVRAQKLRDMHEAERIRRKQQRQGGR